MRELKKRRLRRAQEAGQLDADADADADADVDLDLAVDLIFAPVTRRWTERSGDLTPDGARAIVRHALRGLAGSA